MDLDVQVNCPRHFGESAMLIQVVMTIDGMWIATAEKLADGDKENEVAECNGCDAVAQGLAALLCALVWCAHHLTTIRRKSVSSISEFTQDRLLINGKHGLVLSGVRRREQAEMLN